MMATVIWFYGDFLATSDYWCRYIILNRNGSANLLEGFSRNYNPLTVFHEVK